LSATQITFVTFQSTYYAALLYILSVIAAIIVALVYHRKSFFGGLFLVYLFVDLMIFFIDQYLVEFSPMPKAQKELFQHLGNVLVYLVELLVYLSYFRQILLNRLVKRIIEMMRIVFTLLVFSFAFDAFVATPFIPVKEYSQLIGTVEFLFLLVPCFTYFVELFSKTDLQILYRRPSFWITTGIFQFAMLSIPYYSISYYLTSSNYKYFFEISAIFFYVPLTLNYIILSKAFSCRRILTT
jgi:hypothetical protein